MTQTAEQKADLKAAKEAAPSEDELRSMAARVPPLQRDAEHSFVEAADTDVPVPDEDDLEAASKPGSLTMTRPDPAESTYERSDVFTEAELERLTDDELKAKGFLGKVKSRVPVTHLAGTSDRPRQPGSKAPAAGAGSWPVHEGQMPAVMPTDPPLEDADDQHDLGDNTFAKRAGLSSNKDGSLSRKGLRIEKNEVTEAAALYLRLRQQFPQFTKEQLADEFELQWQSGRSGAAQSHRAGEELSQHGLTEVGDERFEDQAEGLALGKLRASSDRAFEADPDKPSDSGAAGAAGMPSENEPASTAVDAAKEDSGETAKADEQAAAEFAKFDGDGNGKPGGSKPKAK